MKNKTEQFSNITSVGIGLTNQCNLNCPHCYSRILPVESLTLGQVQEITKKFPNINKVNFGTGESILNSELINIMKFFRKNGIKMALTSNGTTVSILRDEYLKWFDDVDISLDFPIVNLHDKWRSAGSFKRAIKGLKRCVRLKIKTSIALCLMNVNYKYLPMFKKILDEYNVALRINLYKPTLNDKFSLSYEQFWKAMKNIADNFLLISNSEPILSIIDKRKRSQGSPCGDKSVRVHPDGMITPCVFLSGLKLNREDFKKMKENIPVFCKKCQYLNQCNGGCLSRRILKHRINKPDEYCPFYKDYKKPNITFKYSTRENDFIHASYLCTLILR